MDEVLCNHKSDNNKIKAEGNTFFLRILFILLFIYIYIYVCTVVFFVQERERKGTKRKKERSQNLSDKITSIYI